ncbi:MAG: hypothetical protein WA996_11850 [Candidatus Promineifilaceae bacterium]
MRQAPKENSKPMPGVIATITAGFELTTSHPWLIAFPILIDLFFWLGPRLSIEQLVERSQRILATDPGLSGMVEQISELSASYNLFTALSVPLVGVPALMSGASPESTPLAPAIFGLNDTTAFIGLFIALTLVGLLLTAIYFSLIALVLRPGKDGAISALMKLVAFMKSTVVAWIRLVILGIFLMVTILIIMLPLLPLAYMVALLSQGLGLMVIMLGIVIVVTYLSMSVPSIITDHRPVGVSVVHSVKIVRRYLLPTMNLLLLVVLIGWGTNLLWHMADAGNWLTLVSIAGHGFVSTALVSSIFIFYRDRTVARIR